MVIYLDFRLQRDDYWPTDVLVSFPRKRLIKILH